MEINKIIDEGEDNYSLVALNCAPTWSKDQ